MKTLAPVSLWLSMLLLGIAGLLAGCGTSPTSAGGFGADATPWPAKPARAVTPTAPDGNSDQPPAVPLTVTLRGKAGDKRELHLNLIELDLRYGERWYTVAKTEDLVKNEPLPLRLTSKESFALLARASVPRRKYSYVKLVFAKEKTVLVRENTPDALLTVSDVPLAIGDWTPSDTKPNLITITVDGGKLVLGDNPSLPADALTAKALSPAGGISGKISPATPTARVDVYWGTSKLLLGSVAPSSQDGSFNVPNLPAGLYRVDVSVPGQRLSEPLKDAVAIEDKLVTLKTMELVAADEK